MKNLIILLLFSTTILAQSNYIKLIKSDSLNVQEYIPQQYAELFSQSNSDEYLMVSSGIYHEDKKNVLYGIYVDFDSLFIKKDSILSITTEKGTRILVECKSSKDIRSSSYGIFVPDDENVFIDFLSANLLTINFSGKTFVIRKNPDYFTIIFNKFNVHPKYFEK